MIKPIKNKILVRSLGTDEITQGGLFVPQNCQKPSDKVEIVATGEGTYKNPMKLKPGQIGFRVMQWGIPVEVDGEILFLMDDNAIIALL